MKIGIITPYAFPEKGAPSMRSDSFYKYFKEKGNDVSLITPYREGFTGGRDRKNKRYKNLNELRNYIKQNQIIIITSPPILTAFKVLPIIKQLGIPYIADNRDLAINAKSHRKLREFMEKRVLKNSDKITVVTDYIKNYYIKNYKISPEKIRLCSNGVDTKIFYYDKKSSKKIRKKHRIPEKSKIVVYEGIIGGHGINEFIYLLDKEFLKNNDLFLILCLIIGDTEKVSESKLTDLERTIKRNGLNSRIRIVKNAKPEELRDYLSAADYGIDSMPLSDDNLYVIPVKTYEYIACRLPVLGLGPKSGELEKLMKKYNVGIFSKTWNELLINLKKHLESKKKIKIDKNLGKKFERRLSAKIMLKIIEEIKNES